MKFIWKQLKFDVKEKFERRVIVMEDGVCNVEKNVKLGKGLEIEPS